MNEQKQLINILVENWTSVFNTTLGRDVRITVDSVDRKNKSEVKSGFAGFEAFVRLSYGEDSAEVMVMAMRNRLVSIIANMMIGLDTFKDEISADDKDVFEEAVNQMFSACQVPLKEGLGLEMKFKDITFVAPANASIHPGKGKFKVWNCTIDLPDVAREKFILVTPRSFGVVEEERVEDTAVEAPAETAHGHIPEAHTVRTADTGPASTLAGHAGEGTGTGAAIDLLMDIELPVTIRVGAVEMRLIDVLKLGSGSIVKLEKSVDDPVDILVDDKLVAKGEVVLCDNNFAVRVTEVLSRTERIKSLV
jgi:flagellar motor switch protein FliN/FliY